MSASWCTSLLCSVRPTLHERTPSCPTPVESDVSKCARCKRRIRQVRMQDGVSVPCDAEPERVVFVEAMPVQASLLEADQRTPEVAGVMRFGFIPHECDRGRKR